MPAPGPLLTAWSAASASAASASAASTTAASANTSSPGWLDRLPWADVAWWQALLDRTLPSRATSSSPQFGWTSYLPLEDATFPSTGPLSGFAWPWATWLVWAALAVGLAFVLVPPLWRATRIGVTFVHELGHAAVGIAMGRRFTGFVVRGDMSGHAVTVGRPRGAGLVLTTWAGYPAPALLGAALVAAAMAGWGPGVMLAVALVCLVTLVFVRSWSTAGTTLVIGLAAGALWWWRDDARSAAVLLAVATVLLLGAWRHWAAVAGAPRGSDPAVLVRLTRWPAWFWVGTHLIVIAAATAAAGWLVWSAVP